jgi:hypothetical protein
MIGFVAVFAELSTERLFFPWFFVLFVYFVVFVV